MPYHLITDDLLQHLYARVDDETAARLSAEVQPTDALPLDAVAPDLSAEAFHRAFVTPLEPLAHRAGLLLAVVVAEPDTQDAQLRAGATRRLMVLPPAPGERRVLRALLREYGERG
ncbi:hypothetical protein [Deinococcus rufus]|uniref:Uncharacterized protein n=1 Tax=Deinococcus rufus TaxID=2136097 RepID=A0ABV7Z8Y5_9DEIO